MAERMNRILLDKVTAMLKEADLPNAYWGEAMCHAAYLYNRTTSVTMKGRTPHECLFGTPPSLKNLKIFECAAYTHIHKTNKRSEVNDHSEQGIFLGIELGLYKIYFPKKQRLYTTKHATFDESTLLLADHSKDMV